MIPWHRYLGLALQDLFTGTDCQVELEKDLSVRKQLLDILIIHRGRGPLPQPLPDGLEDMPEYTLLTFKSFREALDDWVLKELTSHYVSVRKLVSPQDKKLLPESAFRLIAISSRDPRKLASELPLQKQRPGIYEVQRGTDRIRVLVLNEMPDAQQNALWDLFSANRDQFVRGAKRYHPRDPRTSTMVERLKRAYVQEMIDMPYTIEDFYVDLAKEMVEEGAVGKFVRALPPEELLRALPPEERLRDLSPEELRRALPPEERLKGLSPEELARALSPEEREALRRALGAQESK